MTTQVDNGDIYLACYGAGGRGLRVEIRIRDEGVGSPAGDVSWPQFKAILCLGIELMGKVEEHEEAESSHGSLLAALEKYGCEFSTSDKPPCIDERPAKKHWCDTCLAIDEARA